MTKVEFNDLYDSLCYGHDAELLINGNRVFVEWNGEKIELENVTFVPLKLYLSKGKVKMLMGVCRGKKLHDKRETEKKREVERKLREY